MQNGLSRARAHLMRRDAVLKSVIKHVGRCVLQHDPDHFAVLVRSIISQQISTLAARAIHARLTTALGGVVSPESVLAASEETLRGAGLSRGKMASLQDLARHCEDGRIPLASLMDLGDEEVVERLIPVRGIGRWTAEMFLIFSLGRLDVLPVGDYGLRAGVQKQYGLAELPDKKTLTELAECWRPYRSIGTWYIWRSAGFVPQSGE